jgi:hypothetical protein
MPVRDFAHILTNWKMRRSGCGDGMKKYNFLTYAKKKATITVVAFFI